MKLIHASTILIGAAAKHPQKNAAAAGLRGHQQEQGERQMFLFDNWGSNGGGGGSMDDSQASFFDGDVDMLFGSMGNNQCGDTCTDTKVCDSFVSLAAMFDPTSVFEDACNAGCFPKARLEHCEVVCGTGASEGDAAQESQVSVETEAAVSSAIARAGFVDVAAAKESMCGDCKFYSCCVDPNVAADSTKYEACMGYLDKNPQHQAIGDSLLEEVFSNVNAVMDSFTEVLDTVLGGFTQDLNITDTVDILSDIGFDGSQVQEWIDSFDWSSITEDLGMSETFENLQTLFDDAMTNFESFPVTCNPETCPVTGLCDMNVDMASIDFDKICMEDALFQCGEGLKKMCTDECKNPNSDGFAPMCALCNVATCCSSAKENGKSFQDCAMDALTLQEETAIEEEDSSESTVDIPTEDVLVVEETPSQTDESPAAITPAEGDDMLEQSSPSTEESLAITEDSLSETVESSTSTTPDDENEVMPEPQLEGSIQVSIAGVNRVDSMQSGSHARHVSITVALASLTALVFASA